MRSLGLPVWALVLVACVVAPMLVRAWIDFEERRAKERTRAMLQRLGMSAGAGDDGTARADDAGGGNEEESHGSTVRTDR